MSNEHCRKPKKVATLEKTTVLCWSTFFIIYGVDGIILLQRQQSSQSTTMSARVRIQQTGQRRHFRTVSNLILCYFHRWLFHFSKVNNLPYQRSQRLNRHTLSRKRTSSRNRFCLVIQGTGKKLVDNLRHFLFQLQSKNKFFIIPSAFCNCQQK